MRERNIALCIIFTLLTCGIYGIYWMIVLNDEMLDALGENGTSGGMVFLFSLITCGIMDSTGFIKWQPGGPAP